MQIPPVARTRQGKPQGGFTLIELICVIVILGVLAATALPRFADMRREARIASLNGAKGALVASAYQIRGKKLIDPEATTITVDGIDVGLASGYPSAASGGNTAAAAGLSIDDYIIRYGSATATATQPALPINSFAAIPVGVANTPAALGCYVLYVGGSAGANALTPPQVTVVSGSC